MIEIGNDTYFEEVSLSYLKENPRVRYTKLSRTWENSLLGVRLRKTKLIAQRANLFQIKTYKTVGFIPKSTLAIEDGHDHKQGKNTTSDADLGDEVVLEDELEEDEDVVVEKDDADLEDEAVLQHEAAEEQRDELEENEDVVVEAEEEEDEDEDVVKEEEQQEKEEDVNLEEDEVQEEDDEVEEEENQLEDEKVVADEIEEVGEKKVGEGDGNDEEVKEEDEDREKEEVHVKEQSQEQVHQKEKTKKRRTGKRKNIFMGWIMSKIVKKFVKGKLLL